MNERKRDAKLKNGQNLRFINTQVEKQVNNLVKLVDANIEKYKIMEKTRPLR